MFNHTQGGTRVGINAFNNQHITVAGWGMTGQSVAGVLLELGARVTVLNAQEPPDRPEGIEFLTHTDPNELAHLSNGNNTGLLIASPGWPPHHEVISSWQGPIWSDIELAWHISDPHTRWITLTGTNGKTTTIGMVASILKAAGRTYDVVGNVGVPIVSTVWAQRNAPVDNLAVELSSFQLHNVHSISAVSSAVLNFADDHLDWHGSAGAYAEAKAKIYEHTAVACVYNVDVPKTREMVENADVIDGARAIGFTRGTPALAELGVVEESLVDRAYIDNRRTHGQIFANSETLSHLAGPGGIAPHIVDNALAAAALTMADGVTHEQVAAGLREFQPDEHRMQQLGTHAGVHFVNDSKATNAHAAAASLSAMDEGKVVWILGGLAKGAEFDDLVEAYRGKLKAAVIIGVDHEPFSGAIARHAPKIPTEIIDPGNDEIMTAAIHAARRFAEPGDTVLLAPGGASMDQFQSYEKRGEAFAAAVEQIGLERR